MPPVAGDQPGSASALIHCARRLAVSGSPPVSTAGILEHQVRRLPVHRLSAPLVQLRDDLFPQAGRERVGRSLP